MAEQDTEDKSECATPPSQAVKRRCKIPKLNRTLSVKLNGEIPEEYVLPDSRPMSLVLPSSSSKDYHWSLRYRNPGSVSSVHINGEDDRSSLKSFGSFLSCTSYASQNTEASLSRPASRTKSKKYVLHCERHLGHTEEYLTPTQRKDREIRQLKSALMKKTKQYEEKEAEVERLKSEIERLHDVLSEVATNKNVMQSSQESDQLESLTTKTSPSEISFLSNRTDKSEIQIASSPNNDSGISSDMFSSPRDSAIFEETDAPRKVETSDKESLTDPSLLNDSTDFLAETPNFALEDSSKLSLHQSYDQRFDKDAHYDETLQNETGTDVNSKVISELMSRLPEDLEKMLSSCQASIAQVKVEHQQRHQELEKKLDTKVEDLQCKLGEVNSRCSDLRPILDTTKDKILNLETQMGIVQQDLENREEWHNQMYLKMYRKGQEAARLEQSDEISDLSTPKRLSVPDLLRQLHQVQTELDQTKQLYRDAARAMGDRQAEYTLRFLKDAVFYFLTKKDKEHLKAIQSILGFTDAERMAVSKAMKHRRLFCRVFKVKT